MATIHVHYHPSCNRSHHTLTRVDADAAGEFVRRFVDGAAEIGVDDSSGNEHRIVVGEVQRLVIEP
jgi:hypothetical protein